MRARLMCALVLAVALAACGGMPGGLTAVNPTDAQVQEVRVDAVRVADGTKAALTIVRESGKLASSLPLPAAAKDAIDCAVIKVTGTTVEPSAAVKATCGNVPLGPGPLDKALGELGTVTSKPALRVTVKAVMDAVDPLLGKLESSGQPGLAALAASLRATLSFASSFLGGGQ